jgi:hypothetical protein
MIYLHSNHWQEALQGNETICAYHFPPLVIASTTQPIPQDLSGGRVREPLAAVQPGAAAAAATGARDRAGDQCCRIL